MGVRKVGSTHVCILRSANLLCLHSSNQVKRDIASATTPL
uniref:Uncharacterized protein n=1 Tax=Anguilla anguilla TaxID=7936 RepID=A0A0E9U6S8_ANGAN